MLIIVFGNILLQRVGKRDGMGSAKGNGEDVPIDTRVSYGPSLRMLTYDAIAAVSAFKIWRGGLSTVGNSR